MNVKINLICAWRRPSSPLSSSAPSPCTCARTQGSETTKEGWLKEVKIGFYCNKDIVHWFQVRTIWNWKNN